MIQNYNNSTNLYTQLELFILYITTNGVLQCDTVYNQNITLSIESISENELGRCICIVENLNGTKHRCTRNKKFGDICGLHYNRKNNFKTIYNDTTSSNKKKYTITLVKASATKEIQTPEFIDILWNNISYKIDKLNGDVYYDDTEDWVYVDKLANINIPISIY